MIGFCVNEFLWLVLVQFGIGTRVRTLQNVGRRVARLCKLRELCRTITEPSAVAPDAKVKLSVKSIAQLMANVDFRIRRYRARFCNRLFSWLNSRRRITCCFHYQTEPLPFGWYWFSLESARGFELYKMLAAGSRDCVNFGNYAEPSAVAPDAKVKLSVKSIAQLMANVDFRIRRYRARFCNRLFSLLNYRRRITCCFHYQTEPLPFGWYWFSLESARRFELYKMLAAGSRDCVNFGNYAEPLQNRAR